MELLDERLSYVWLLHGSIPHCYVPVQWGGEVVQSGLCCIVEDQGYDDGIRD